MTSNQIKTAVILAAGMGNRLKPFTNNKPKCMVEISGKPLLAHTIDALEMHGYTRLIIITGYMSEILRNFTLKYRTSLQVEFIHNDSYDITNNIYSLWLASDKVREGFTLIESDIIMEAEILERFTSPDRIALDYFDRSKQSGTTAKICPEGYLEKLFVEQSPPSVADEIYKTVNIYSFSEKSGQKLFQEIDRIIRQGNVKSFYEVAIRNMVIRNEISLKIVCFNSVWWDEIDTTDDLERVENYLSNNISVLSGEEFNSEI